MITNSDDINRYSSYNKIYVPTDFKNSNYIYKLNGDYILIITNNNCYQNYNSTYCDCYNYNHKNNLITEAYSCNVNNNNPTINYNYISDDINYSNHLVDLFFKDNLLNLTLLFVAILLALFITKDRSCL